MTRLPLPQNKPHSWPYRVWDKDLITIGLNEKPDQMMALLLDNLKFIRRHHWYSYVKITQKMRHIVDGK